MPAGDLAFAALAVNPIGGLTLAIPVRGLRAAPSGLAYVAGVPLAYLQVVVVDLCWTQLVLLKWWNAFMERRRSPRVERLVTSQGFWLTAVLTPFIGPWIIMAFMRYAHVPQRRVALPILLGLAWSAGAVAVACVVAPRLWQ